MKRLLATVACIWGCTLCTYAQDVITKKDGTDIQAKILEVNSSEIKYKKFSNLDGPVFTMSKSDILIVRYANGENEVFTDSKKSVSLNTDKTVYPGMMYKEYKDFYNSKEYVRQPGDPYSPFWVGFAECFIPGLGEGIAGEWGRAAGFFFANVGLGAIAFSQRAPYNYNGYTYYKYNDLYWVMMAARLCLNIWSICDAVHVAKVKNMYNQDLRAQRASLDFGLEPYFACAPNSVSGMWPVAGLSLKVRF